MKWQPYENRYLPLHEEIMEVETTAPVERKLKVVRGVQSSSYYILEGGKIHSLSVQEVVHHYLNTVEAPA